MPVGIMYNLETDEEKRKRRAITCPSHNPIIVSMNQPAPEKTKGKPREEKPPFTAPGCPCRPWGSSWGGGLEEDASVNDESKKR
jgi:hypothetical protein